MESKEIDFFFVPGNAAGYLRIGKIMGDKTMETIEDIVREMRECVDSVGDDGNVSAYLVNLFSDRIDYVIKVAVSKMETTTHGSEAK